MRMVPVATAAGQLQAEMWRDLLRDEGILASLAPGDAISFLGSSAMPCRVVVPEEQAERARQVLAAQDIPVQ